MSVTYSRSAVIESTPLNKLPFIVYEDFEVTWSRPGKELVKFTIPKNFATDLASIPRGARNIVSKITGIQPAIVHDWCYKRNTNLTKKEADLMFLDGLRSHTVGVGKFRSKIMYYAVRAGGKGHWAEHK